MLVQHVIKDLSVMYTVHLYIFCIFYIIYLHTILLNYLPMMQCKTVYLLLQSQA